MTVAKRWKIYARPHPEDGKWVVVVRADREDGDVIERREFGTEADASEWILAEITKGAGL